MTLLTPNKIGGMMISWTKASVTTAKVVIALAVVTIALAGTTGNLTGKVTDLSTGELLTGVNILVVGSGRGGVSNTKGEYGITGITPGKYTVRVSSIGYKTAEIKNVEIEADVSTVLNFKLASTEIEMEGVTTYGERPIVDNKKFSGDQTFSRDKIEQLPNVKGVEDILAVQAGVVKHGSQFFLRGGRADETLTIIDGVPVYNVSGVSQTVAGGTNKELQQLYAGTGGSTGGALSVAANAIQSVSVSSSGFEAEYGNAQSGVINITTKSGADRFSGGFQVRSDGIVGNDFGERYYSGDISGPEPITTFLLPSLGVEIPGRISFFVNADFNQSNGAYAFNQSQFYNPTRRRVHVGGIFGGLLDGLGFTFSDKLTNSLSFNSKLTYVLGDNDQFMFTYRANVKSDKGIVGQYEWRDFSDSAASSLSLTTQNVLQWTHIVGTNTLIKSSVSRKEYEKVETVGALTPEEYSRIRDEQLRDPIRNGFQDLGSEQRWYEDKSVVWTIKSDFGSQVHPIHYLKFGFELNLQRIQSTDIWQPWGILEDSIALFQGRYPGIGQGRWFVDVTPSFGTLYLQDNIDFGEGLLSIHPGLRYDFRYLGREMFDRSPTGFAARWENLTELRADWLDHPSFLAQFARGYFSPRISIGYPVSQTTKFYFNYGHFIQWPQAVQYYHAPIYSLLDGNYVGNPSLKPQRTVQYEAGFEQAIFDDLGIAIRGFYKDNFDYIRRTNLEVSPPLDLNINLDYASTRGVEVVLNKALSRHYTGNVAYTFSVAKGREPTGYSGSGARGLPREVRLDYDKTHVVNLFLGYRVGPNEDYDLLGINFNNWGASVTWTFSSGSPYTPLNFSRSLDAQYLANSGTGPYRSELNLSLYKGLRIFEKLNLIATLDVINLLNRRNVDQSRGGFNTSVGRPIVFGDVDARSRVIYPWSYGAQSFALRVPPYVFEPPRQINLGLKINWD